MRLLLILLVLLSACKSPAPTVPAGFVARHVRFLADDRYSLLAGYLRLNVPVRYDTLLHWVDQGDAAPTLKYRFTSARGCLLQERGYIQQPACTQAVDRLTILTDHYSGMVAGDTTGFHGRCQALERAEHEMGNTFAWRARKVLRLDHRVFTVQEFCGARYRYWLPGQRKRFRWEPYQELLAQTIVQQGKGAWLISFRFECTQAACPAFSQQAYTILSSVHLDSLAVAQTTAVSRANEGKR
ncbi:hypothetical protein [Hymenobacter sp. GOD-10R]|uniref:hypothetical protein n=1 Tax=Hymenobacter sp. GOD-10R TaxID=3093922 RepID=UPI002D789E3A|nr:hypothetical protein [Hymenobacter sp. GOD-10R]WRQ31870.1 hypothetical protein SD425_29440 [Hymenobacter sp. GOD-10R]